jgi:hypothetical protein
MPGKTHLFVCLGNFLQDWPVTTILSISTSRIDRVEPLRLAIFTPSVWRIDICKYLHKQTLPQ